MAKASPLQSNFGGGEISPLVYGRVDAERYKTCLATCLNYVPMIQGGLTRRPGTQYAAQVKDSSKEVRLEAFEFSITQAYILEIGDQYIRFYMNNGQILDTGVPYEISTPYLEADLFQLKFTQSADVLYITHPDYQTRKLSRTGHINWTLTAISFTDGPYLPTNTTSTTLTPSAFAVGAGVTLTASATTGINGGDGFKTTDVGRVVRAQQGSTWGWARITAWTSTTVVTIEIFTTWTSIAAKSVWRLGVWSDTTGWPACSTFYEDRLMLAGATDAPQRIDGSNTADYENFSPSDAAGTIVASNAVSFTLNSSTVNVIRWLAADERGLVAGTVGEEWIVRPTSINEPLSAVSPPAAKPTTHEGSADVEPVQMGKAVVFLQRAGRKFYELRYVFESDGFSSGDLTVLAEHITQSGVKQMAYQKEPHSLLWAVREDGVLACLTYKREEGGNLRAGWHRHIVGGFSDAAHEEDAIVESVAVIPSADGTYSELWMVVNRYINGGTKRYVEYMTKFFEDTDEQDAAFFVDGGLHYEGAAATVISGLGHLEGETVTVMTGGGVHPDRTVSGGSITLNAEAEHAHIGYGYNSDGQMLRLETGSQDGTALGKTRRTHRVGFMLHRSLGLSFGTDFDNLDDMTFREAGEAMDTPPALFTGIKSQTLEAGYDFENNICWRQSQPLPSTILAVMPQMVTQDRG